MTKNNRYITLNTGTKIPVIGLGTWKSPPEKAGEAVAYALAEAGYRHIDCAAIYLNEKEIGNALKKVFASGKVKRENVFITSKLWNTEHAREDVAAACKHTLKDLQLDYLDLYLIHWGVATLHEEGAQQLNARGEPTDKDGFLQLKKISTRETWEAMEQLVNDGLVRAIGVANFTGAMLVDLLSYAKIRPAINQIELHPYNQQTRLVEFCQHQKIAVTAYSPLGSPGNVKKWGKNEPILVEDKTITAIATNHKKSPAHILIRWGIQRGTIVIPKSVTPERIKDNMNVFDFELSVEEMAMIAALDKKRRYVDLWDWWKLPYFD